MPQASLARTAVDKATEEYWSKYFEEYGRQWTRKIPRRVAEALKAEIAKKTAAVGGAAHPVNPDERPIAPLGRRSYSVLQDGGLAFEGVFRYRSGAPDTPLIRRAFCATFDGNGNLTKLAVAQAA